MRPPLTAENKARRQRPKKPAPDPRAPLEASRKILNNNIVRTNPSLFSCSERVLGEAVDAERPSARGLARRAEVRRMEDFRDKFFESHLDKVISWKELQSIAAAIGSRDWGYVKYILTIICLMLKSYQNISHDARDQPPPAPGDEPNALIVPQKRLAAKRAFARADIEKQLLSLNALFKKMKNIDIQMNISNCWDCHRDMCRLHGLCPGPAQAPK